MSGALDRMVAATNTRMAKLLDSAQGALRGEASFGPEEVRALQVVLEDMAPVTSQFAELRRQQPELREALELYRSHLVNLQQTVEKIRITLLVRRATIEAKRTQVSARSQWCNAFHQTR